MARRRQAFLQVKAILLPQRQRLKKGAAVLLSDLEGKDVQAYAIEIESLEKNGGKTT